MTWKSAPLFLRASHRLLQERRKCTGGVRQAGMKGIKRARSISERDLGAGSTPKTQAHADLRSQGRNQLEHISTKTTNPSEWR